MFENYLFDYQKAFITCDDTKVIWCKSRRIGATLAQAFWSVRRRSTIKIDEFFISTRQETAEEYIRYCKKVAEGVNLILNYSFINLSGATNACLTFPNGSRIVAMPSNAESIRGLGGDLCWDEAAFHEDANDLYRAISPVITWGGKLHIISTENGPQTVFHELQAKDGFKVFKTTLIDAVNQGLALKVPGDHRKLLPNIVACNEAFIEEKKRTSLSQDHYKTEYLCETTTSSTVISEEEYNKCVFNNLPVATILNLTDHYNNLSVGVDIGRSKNLTVIWIIEEGQDPKAPNEQLKICYRTVCQIELQNVPYSAQYQQIDAVISHPSVVKCVIDQGAIGAQLSEDLKSKWGYKVVPMSINHTSKARLIERVKKFIAQKRITLPSDIETKKDIISMKRVAMKSGGFTYDGQSGQSHCDRFLALSMALEAAESMAQFELIPQSREFTH